MGGSLSTERLHVLVVTTVQYAIAFVCSAFISTKLYKGFFDSNNTTKSICDLNPNQWIALVICVSLTLGVPFQWASMFEFDRAYDKAKRSSDKDDTMIDHIDWTTATLVGLPGTLTMTVSLLLTIYLNITKLEVFNGTMSQISKQRERAYQSWFGISTLLCIAWIIWIPFSGSDTASFAIFSMLNLVQYSILFIIVIFEFSTRLHSFLEITQRKRATVISFSSTDLSDSDQSLLRVIIKQSLLSVLQMMSVFISGVFFLISIFILGSGGINNAYIRLGGTTQVTMMIPLYIYLSFEFADSDYRFMCSGIHQYFEDCTKVQIIGQHPSIETVSPSSESTL